ncbi:hypothetical protein M9458_056914 [Cirrhinus mrigala]|uniref:Uncharacterized protein n=1 Tax=Cirrhinus mrigala TaxID=683832 RepID=A0ABD0MGI4_CIRMR
MLYLKSYLTGEARKAVEGFFYRSSKDSYESAWSVLKDRYGNPFVVHKANRDKLMKWPKIGPNDPLALRDFADFLKDCLEAMPHVKGLAILNDSEENHKLLKKLPEWAVRKWSRIVVEELDTSGEYPTFEHFAEFVQKETCVACNPITSSFLLSSRSLDDKLPRRAKTFSTSKWEIRDILYIKIICALDVYGKDMLLKIVERDTSVEYVADAIQPVYMKNKRGLVKY